jgi:hypothetical protein
VGSGANLINQFMSSAFTVLWSADRVKVATTHGRLNQPIPFLFGGPHTSQPSFIRAGVEPGDIIYPVTVTDGQIHILARVVTKEILSVETFIADRPELYPLNRRGRWMGETLDIAKQRQPWLGAYCWTSSDHVLMAESSSILTTEVVLPLECLERLTFRSNKAERLIKGVIEGKLTTITGLQNVYRLAEGSLADFATVAKSLG